MDPATVPLKRLPLSTEQQVGTLEDVHGAREAEDAAGQLTASPIPASPILGSPLPERPAPRPPTPARHDGSMAGAAALPGIVTVHAAAVAPAADPAGDPLSAAMAQIPYYEPLLAGLAPVAGAEGRSRGWSQWLLAPLASSETTGLPDVKKMATAEALTPCPSEAIEDVATQVTQHVQHCVAQLADDQARLGARLHHVAADYVRLSDGVALEAAQRAQRQRQHVEAAALAIAAAVTQTKTAWSALYEALFGLALPFGALAAATTAAGEADSGLEQLGGLQTRLLPAERFHAVQDTYPHLRDYLRRMAPSGPPPLPPPLPPRPGEGHVASR